MRLRPVRMTPDQIDAFAKNMESGDLITSLQVPDPTVPWRWFLPVAFLEQALAESVYYEGYTVIYEYASFATSWRIQGFPVFGSCLFIHQQDFESAIDLIVEERNKAHGKTHRRSET